MTRPRRLLAGPTNPKGGRRAAASSFSFYMQIQKPAGSLLGKRAMRSRRVPSGRSALSRVSAYRELLALGESLSAFHGGPMTGPGTRATMKRLQFMHSIRFLAVSGLKPTLTNIVWPHCEQSICMTTDCE